MGERGVTDPAPRDVDHPHERLVVRRVRDQPQIGEDVLHLAALVEAHGPHQPVGDPPEPERLLQRAGLRVGAVQDRHAFVGNIRLGGAPCQLRCEPLRLVALVGRRQQRDGLATLRRGEQRLAEPPRIFRDHPVGGVEDHLRGAVVLLELDQGRGREVLLERQHVTHVGSAPAVDRLIVVTHHAEVRMPGGEQLHEAILRRVCVLKLVHQHVLESLLPVGESLRVLPEQRERVEQQVVEVHGVRLPERRPELRVDLGGDTLQRALGLSAQFLSEEITAWIARGGFALGDSPRCSSRRLMNDSESSWS